MIFRILGSAAGGAFPQWNCACANCSRLRAGSIAARPRTQSQLAVSRDGRDWHLFNASPDLRLQIESTPELQPRPEQGTRNSPIRSVTLTNADLDHVLGLLLLRESQPLVIRCTRSVQRILLEDNSFFGMLRQTETQTRWEVIEPGRELELEPGLKLTPLPLSDRFPRYVRPERAAQLAAHDAVLGLVVRSNGRSLGYFPGLGQVTPELERVFESCDTLLVDGTFWDEAELQRAHPGGTAKTAREMNHLALSGPSGTLARFARFKRPRKIFVHINNTNPILDEKSDEHKLARDAGWEVGFDGMEIRL